MYERKLVKTFVPDPRKPAAASEAFAAASSSERFRRSYNDFAERPTPAWEFYKVP